MYAAISIIVLFHDNEYFEQNINSIIAQLKAGDEIIIVNDCSDSKYFRLMEKISHSANIKVISTYKVRGNRSYNRNRGAMYAQNPILTFVDGDIYFPENLFDSMRKQLEEQNYCAIYGNIYGHSGSLFTINNILGIDYLNMLFDSEKWKDLKNYPLLQDSRQKKEKELLSGEFSWNYFYTSYCMVKKSVFYKAGQFDESFSNWGAEDVDLGYRLAQYGRILYDNELVAFHIPHKKNKQKNSITNRQNMYYMLNKYKTSIFEIKITYEKSQKVFQSFEYFYKIMREIDTDTMDVAPIHECIYCNTVSHKNKDGDIFYLNSEGNQEHLKLLGLALPFSNKYFEIAYLPYSIFLYPYPLAARIIQEFLRISKDVYIKNTPISYRVQWSPECIKAFKSSSPFTNIYYACKSLDDFEFNIVNEQKLINVIPAFKYYEDVQL